MSLFSGGKSSYRPCSWSVAFQLSSFLVGRERRRRQAVTVSPAVSYSGFGYGCALGQTGRVAAERLNLFVLTCMLTFPESFSLLHCLMASHLYPVKEGRIFQPTGDDVLNDCYRVKSVGFDSWLARKMLSSTFQPRASFPWLLCTL